jgi:hypothetical protein
VPITRSQIAFAFGLENGERMVAVLKIASLLVEYAFRGTPLSSSSQESRSEERRSAGCG